MNKWLLAISTAVVAVVLGSTATTQARWSDEVELSSGALRSGTLRLLNGDHASQVSSYAFTELAMSDMAPGSAAQAPLVLRNDGDADLHYGLIQATSTPQTGLSDSLSVTIRTAVAETDCPAGAAADEPSDPSGILYSGPLGTELSRTSRELPVGRTQALCVQVRLDRAAPPAAQAKSTTITLTFYAEMTP